MGGVNGADGTERAKSRRTDPFDRVHLAELQQQLAAPCIQQLAQMLQLPSARQSAAKRKRRAHKPRSLT